ncbi:MAG: hypothetical protein WC803_12900 [Sphingomonas sp.]|jgi:hypothetical protein
MKTIFISNKELIENAPHSNLSSTVASGVSTLSVYSISQFAINKVLLIGEFGQEGSEIIKTHSATAPTGTTITLATALAKSHPKDVKVSILPYDQAEFSYASTATGSKTVLATSDIDEEANETSYDDTTYTSGYYFTRFKNSINGNYSAYSDPIPYAGFNSNTVSYIVQLCLSETGKKVSETLTYERLTQEINACLRYVRGKLKTWSNMQEFDYVLDQMHRGEYSWTLPTTYYDKNSNRSMLQVKVGKDRKLDYKDKIEFDQYFEDTVVSQATAALIGAVSVVLDSTDDFPSSGTAHFYISNTQYDIAFTANNKTTNTLTCTALTIALPEDTNVWYNESEGTPQFFSVWDGSLYVWPICNATTNGKNIYLDFYTDITEVDSDADEITLARYDMVKHWLKWQIRNITEKQGVPDFQDGDWLMFSQMLTDAVRRESSGQKHKLSPRINGINYRGEGRVTNQSFDVT